MAGKRGFETRSIHSGNCPKEWLGATQAPIFQSAAFKFETAEGLSLAFSGKRPGFIYQRLHNPTSEVLAQRLADLEAGKKALVFASGMSAITNTILTLVRAGDEIISGKSLFFSTYLFFTRFLPRFGVKAHLLETAQPKNFQDKINKSTRLIYLETIGNPAMDVPDIKAISQIAHKAKIPLVVDNTLATPYLFKPIEQGANLVVHSTTKFLNGHGSAVGGAVIDGGNFNWASERFPDFKEARKRAGSLAFWDKLWREVFVILGSYQAPVHSYLTLLGLETLSLRMEKHFKNALELAKFLKAHPKVSWVNYPGLVSSPYHKTATRLFSGKGYGALLCFGLKSQSQCFKFINNLKVCYNLANLGDAKTLVIHPYSTQYISFSEKEKAELGIKQELIRVSVGIEDIEDVVDDFRQALKEL